MRAARHAVGLLTLSILLFLAASGLGRLEAVGLSLPLLQPELVSLGGWIALGLFGMFVLAIAVEWTSQGVDGPRR